MPSSTTTAVTTSPDRLRGMCWSRVPTGSQPSRMASCKSMSRTLPDELRDQGNAKGGGRRAGAVPPSALLSLRADGSRRVGMRPSLARPMVGCGTGALDDSAAAPSRNAARDTLRTHSHDDPRCPTPPATTQLHHSRAPFLERREPCLRPSLTRSFLRPTEALVGLLACAHIDALSEPLPTMERQ
jgi:hypothetical protein